MSKFYYKNNNNYYENEYLKNYIKWRSGSWCGKVCWKLEAREEERELQ